MTCEPAHRCQLLTPPGAGAIAIIRVTGPSPAALVDTLFQCASGPTLQATTTSRIRYGQIIQAGEVLDDVVAYRVEDGKGVAVDLCCHGGIRVVERVLDALEGAGAALDLETGDRPAWASANRIEEEALELLPTVTTQAAVMFLTWQRDNTPRWLEETADCCMSDPNEAWTRIEGYLARAETARRIVHGATVVLIGPPNSGKSTLFNRLVGRDAAIVSPVEGTTRDWVNAAIEIHGMPVTLIDTAGQHPGAEQLERVAIETERQRASVADLVLIVLDGSVPLVPESVTLLAEHCSSPSILVLNKVDIASARNVSEHVGSGATTVLETVCVSALEGAGIPELVESMSTQLCAEEDTWAQPAPFTLRQTELASRVSDLLEHDGGAAAGTIREELNQNCA